MDVYEKMSIAAQENDFTTVAYQFGRAIRRAILFESMVSAPMDDEITIQPDPSEVQAVKETLEYHINTTYPRVM